MARLLSGDGVGADPPLRVINREGGAALDRRRGAALGIAQRILVRAAVLHLHDPAVPQGHHLIQRFGRVLRLIVDALPAALDDHVRADRG